jgi:hypothetical protein
LEMKLSISSSVFAPQYRGFLRAFEPAS